MGALPAHTRGSGAEAPSERQRHDVMGLFNAVGQVGAAHRFTSRPKDPASRLAAAAPSSVLGPMRHALSCLVVALTACTASADPPAPQAPPATTTTTTTTQPPAPAPAPAADSATSISASQQLVVVTTAGWGAKSGRLRRFERGPAGFVPVGPAVDIVVGGGGMGWGIGLHGGSPGEPRKMEGDGRAPAGVFRLTRTFGKAKAPRSSLPSAQIAPGDLCIDDVSHASYNRLVPVGEAIAPAKSAEQLHRKDWLYDELVVVDQNHAEDGARPIAGRGSCVFLHVWRKKGSGTAGCTAMDARDLSDVIAWLDASKSPLLVQLPADVYDGVRAAWGLPTR